MKIPKDTSKLKKHIALLCDRLNKGGKLDLSLTSASQQTDSVAQQPQQQKTVLPLEPLRERHEEEDANGRILVSIMYGECWYECELYTDSTIQ